MDTLPKKDRAVVTEKLEEDGLAAVDREDCEQNLDYYDVGCPRGRRPDNAGSPFHCGVENDRVVEKRGLQGHGMGPDERYTMEAQSWVPQQRSTVGHTDGEMGWRKGMTGSSLWRSDNLVRKM